MNELLRVLSYINFLLVNLTVIMNEVMNNIFQRKITKIIALYNNINHCWFIYFKRLCACCSRRLNSYLVFALRLTTEWVKLSSVCIIFARTFCTSRKSLRMLNVRMRRKSRIHITMYTLNWKDHNCCIVDDDHHNKWW